MTGIKSIHSLSFQQRQYSILCPTVLIFFYLYTYSKLSLKLFIQCIFFNVSKNQNVDFQQMKNTYCSTQKEILKNLHADMGRHGNFPLLFFFKKLGYAGYVYSWRVLMMSLGIRLGSGELYVESSWLPLGHWESLWNLVRELMRIFKVCPGLICLNYAKLPPRIAWQKWM